MRALSSPPHKVDWVALSATSVEILGSLYKDSTDAKRLVDMAGIPTEFIHFDAKMRNVWHEVVTEARKRTRLGRLLASAHMEYGERGDLAALLAEVRLAEQPATGLQNASASDGVPGGRSAQVPPNWAASVEEKLEYFKTSIVLLESYLNKYKEASEFYGRSTLFSREVRQLQALLPQGDSEAASHALYLRHWNANSGDVLESYSELSSVMVEEWLAQIEPPLVRVKPEFVDDYERKSGEAARCIDDLTGGFDERSATTVLQLLSKAKVMEIFWATVARGLYLRIDERFRKMAERLEG